MAAESEQNYRDFAFSQAVMTPLNRIRAKMSRMSPGPGSKGSSFHGDILNANKSIFIDTQVNQRRHLLSHHSIFKHSSNQNTPTITKKKEVFVLEDEVIPVPKTAPLTRYKLIEQPEQPKQIQEEIEDEEDDLEEDAAYTKNYDELAAVLAEIKEDEAELIDKGRILTVENGDLVI